LEARRPGCWKARKPGSWEAEKLRRWEDEKPAGTFKPSILSTQLASNIIKELI